MSAVVSISISGFANLPDPDGRAKDGVRVDAVIRDGEASVHMAAFPDWTCTRCGSTVTGGTVHACPCGGISTASMATP